MNSGNTAVPFLVVGGGIGGVAAALALAKIGRRVRVLERAPRFSEVGAGLQLAPNAMRVLDRLGVRAAIEAVAVFPEKISVLDIYNADLLKVVEIGPKFVTRFGYRYVLIHRSDLLQILIDACVATGLVTLEAGREVTEVVDHGDSAAVHCRDGSTYVCDGLIAADGIGSIICRTLFPGEPAKPIGYVAYRGTIPETAMLPHSGPSDLVFWVGPDIHLVQYPLRQQKLFNQVVVFKSDQFFEGSTDWGSVKEMEDRFLGAHPAVQAALATIGRERCWQLHDRPPRTTWARNRIVLLGDAAHPMLQFLAQGAAQALEDSLFLASMLVAHEDIERAFIAFQNGRYLRTAVVQAVTRYADEFWHAGGVRAVARNEYLKNHPADRYEEMDWLYGSDEPKGPLPTMNSISHQKELIR